MRKQFKKGDRRIPDQGDPQQNNQRKNHTQGKA